MPFKKEKFKKIFSKEYGNYEYVYYKSIDEELARAFFIPLKKLEYVIKPYENNLISLSLEETIDIKKTDFSLLRYVYFKERDGSSFVKHKYLHMILDKNTAEIAHLDLSYLYYFNEKIELRSNQHIKDKTVNADYKKKVVRIDAKGKFKFFAEFEQILGLAGSLMDGNRNPEIIKFFDGM